VHEQLSQRFRGEMSTVDRSPSYDATLVKVYAAGSGVAKYLIVLNKDVNHQATVRKTSSKQDVAVR
jgi:hypothetical protein